jgi:hypothetical protein
LVWLPRFGSSVGEGHRRRVKSFQLVAATVERVEDVVNGGSPAQIFALHGLVAGVAAAALREAATRLLLRDAQPPQTQNDSQTRSVFA